MASDLTNLHQTLHEDAPDAATLLDKDIEHIAELKGGYLADAMESVLDAMDHHRIELEQLQNSVATVTNHDQAINLDEVPENDADQKQVVETVAAVLAQFTSVVQAERQALDASDADQENADKLNAAMRDQMVRSNALVQEILSVDNEYYAAKHQEENVIDDENADLQEHFFHDFNVGSQVVQSLHVDLQRIAQLQIENDTNTDSAIESRSLPATIDCLEQALAELAKHTAMAEPVSELISVLNAARLEANALDHDVVALLAEKDEFNEHVSGQHATLEAFDSADEESDKPETTTIGTSSFEQESAPIAKLPELATESDPVAALSAAAEGIAELRHNITLERAQVQKLQNQYQKQGAELERLQESLQTTMADLNDQQSMVAHKEIELADQVEQLAQKERELVSLKSDLADSHSECEVQKAEVAATQEELAQTKQEVEQTQASLEEAQNTLADKEVAVSDVQAQLSEAQQELATMFALITSKAEAEGIEVADIDPALTDAALSQPAEDADDTSGSAPAQRAEAAKGLIEQFTRKAALDEQTVKDLAISLVETAAEEDQLVVMIADAENSESFEGASESTEGSANSESVELATSEGVTAEPLSVPPIQPDHIDVDNAEDIEQILAVSKQVIAHLRQRRDDLQNHLVEQDAVIEQRVSEIAGLQDTQQTLEASLKSEQETVADKQAALFEAEQTISDHEQKISEQEQALAATQQEVEHYGAQLQDQELTLAQQVKDIADGKASLALQVAETEALQKDLETEQTNHQATQQTLTEREQERDNLQQEKASLQQELSDVQQQLSQTQETLTDREQTVEHLSGQLQDQELTLASQMKEIEALKAEVAEQTDSLAQRAAEIDGHQQRIADMEQQLAEATQNTIACQSTIAEQEEELTQRQSTINDQRQQLAELEQQKAASEQRVAELTEELAAAQQAAREQADQASDAAAGQAAKLDDLQRRIADRDQKLQGLQSNIDRMQSEKIAQDVVEARQASLQEARDNDRQKIASLEQQIEDLQAHIKEDERRDEVVEQALQDIRAERDALRQEVDQKEQSLADAQSAQATFDNERQRLQERHAAELADKEEALQQQREELESLKAS